MPHPNEAWGELQSGCFVLLKEYLGGYNVAGSGSWAVDYYNGPYEKWRERIQEGQIQIIKRTTITEQELVTYYIRLGYMK